MCFGQKTSGLRIGNWSVANRHRHEWCDSPGINQADTRQFGIVSYRQSNGLIDGRHGIVTAPESHEYSLQHLYISPENVVLRGNGIASLQACRLPSRAGRLVRRNLVLDCVADQFSPEFEQQLPSHL
jgi:hypothetical protein